MIELHTPHQAAQWLHSQGCTLLQCDSRLIKPSQGFIAWPGYVHDSRSFVIDAIEAGAHACLVESEGIEKFKFGKNLLSKIACYQGLKKATGDIANIFYKQPSHQLKIIAVTGTNGKTSIAWWLAQLLNQKAKVPQSPVCYNIGTLGIGIPPNMTYNGLTTPDPVLLQTQFASMQMQGINYCAIEASSIGISEYRLVGTQIDCAIFTNLTQDHLDYHNNIQSYWEVKFSLFKHSNLKHAIVNIDDVRGLELAQYLSQRSGLSLWCTFISSSKEDLVSVQKKIANIPCIKLWATDINYKGSYLSFTVTYQNNSIYETAFVKVPTLGLYNVANFLNVIACALTYGIPLKEITDACTDLLPVPGRLEPVSFTNIQNLPLVLVDFAHTPDALGNILKTLKPIANERGGKLWCIFGCGGDRDKHKRPIMGNIAQSLAHHIVITSDNPRTENASAISDDILKGIDTAAINTIVELDRKMAIYQTIQKAACEDIVLIAGKGHENYQEISGIRHPFNDKIVARQALELRIAQQTHSPYEGERANIHG